MASPGANTERDVLPRWRSVRRTAEAGEFQSLRDRLPLEPDHEDEIDEFESRWREVGTDVAAGEFVAAATVAGEPERAAEAAKVLTESRRLPFMATLADSGANARSRRRSPDSSREFFHGRIAQEKRRLRNDPRNAVTWADLARRYTVLGQFEQAAHALEIALALAPDSRYMLRIASRFYVHIGEPERAFSLLNDSARTREDPWLAAAHLSVASVANLPVGSLRQARRIAENTDFLEIERSELESELGTLDLRAGSDRKARKLFRSSLVAPTDNSLAQVEWASHKLSAFDVPLEEIDIPFADEARARAATQAGRWEAALGDALNWIDDQQFDPRATTHGSYIAAVGLQDYQTCTHLAEIGLRANPDDVTLANNLAFAQIHLGDFESAADTLGAISDTGTEPGEETAVLATRGLLAFRTGAVEEGRRLYAEAIASAARRKARRQEAMARAMLLTEELRAVPQAVSAEMIAEVQRLAESSKDAGALACAARLAQLTT